jgi:pyruvate,water dikinase
MHFYTLDQIQATHRSEVGDTAFHLAQTLQQGYPVLPGIVITASVLNDFLEHIDWLEPLFADLPNSTLHIEVEDPRQLQAIARTIRQAIESNPFTITHWIDEVLHLAQSWSSKQVVLKPSLSLSPEVGYFLPEASTESLIDAKIYPLTDLGLREGVRHIWSDLFSAKSLFYWQRLGISLQHIQLAILVQPIATPDLSGDLYLNEQSLDIRAIWGVDQAIATGEVCPDWYRVDLSTGQILDQKVAQKFYRCAVRLPDAAPEAIAPIPAIQPGLDLVAIDPSEQRAAVLSPPNLSALVDLARTIAQQNSRPIRVNWLLSSLLPNPTVWISHITPQTRPYNLSATAQSTTLTHQPISTSPETLWGIGVAQGQISGQVWVANERDTTLPNLPPDCILVATVFMPTWLPQLHHIAGIITEQGGITSHGAIVAREVGIPAVVGVLNATQQLHTGDRITVDGDRGGIYRGSHPPIPPLEITPKHELESPPADRSAVATVSPHRIQLWVNLNRWSTLPQLDTLPIDGVGLVRSEIALMELIEQRHPLDWIAQHQSHHIQARLVEQLQQLAKAMAPRPIFYRSLDMRSHEYQLLRGSPSLTPEVNPILGMHGTLSYTLNPAWFQLELAAIRQVQQMGYTNLNLLLPFVRTVEEFQFCHQWVMRAGLTQVQAFQIWIMAEVPSVVWLLPDYVKAGVQGIAIGTNDLTQLLLAIDRDHPGLSSRLDTRHPAVLRAIAQLVSTAKQLQIPCSICGQIPLQDANLLQTFIQWGISAISVEPHTARQMHNLLLNAERSLSNQPQR